MKKANPILIIISILLPIVGYILYFTTRGEDEDTACSYLWSAIGGSVVGLLLIM